MLSTSYFCLFLRALVEPVGRHQEPMPINACHLYVVEGAIRAFYSTPVLHGGGQGAFGAGHEVQVLVSAICGVANLLVVYRRRNVDGHWIPFYGGLGSVCASMDDMVSGLAQRPVGRARRAAGAGDGRRGAGRRRGGEVRKETDSDRWHAQRLRSDNPRCGTCTQCGSPGLVSACGLLAVDLVRWVEVFSRLRHSTLVGSQDPGVHTAQHEARVTGAASVGALRCSPHGMQYGSPGSLIAESFGTTCATPVPGLATSCPR
jgi:hypothetical protein